MLSRTAPRILRYTARPGRLVASTSQIQTPTRFLRPSSNSSTPHTVASRSFHSTGSFAKGLQPDTEDPRPPHSQAPVAGAAAHVTEPTPLSPEEYYEYSEHYFNVLLGELEKAQEEGSDVEAEYSVSLPFPPLPCSATSFISLFFSGNKLSAANPFYAPAPAPGPKKRKKTSILT